MSVTQKQIAERLNISPSLVARALMGHKEVAEKTRVRVQETAREMGYQSGTNREARALIARRYGRRLKNGVIAVMFPPLGAAPQHLPFYTSIFDAMEEEAVARDINVCLCPLRPDELPRLIRERNVDGVISMGYPVALAAEIRALELPLVTFHDRYDDMHSVMPDDRDGARLATRHLLELGHRRIGFLGVLTHVTNASARRLEGYLDAMQEYGVSVPEEWIENSLPIPTVTPTSFCDKYEKFGQGCKCCAACAGWARLLGKNGGISDNGQLPFTAIVCHNDSVAMGLITQARLDGREAPQDFSVVGFDDLTLQYRFLPPVTSVHLPLAEMGKAAVSLLYEIVQRDGEQEQPEHYIHQVLPVHLTVRKSTTSPPRMLTTTK
jgi:DNA-binding LacI/PurR family transcriptional regulator